MLYVFCVAPKVVDVAYSMIKPFLNDNTMSRISFYGPEPEVQLHT